MVSKLRYCRTKKDLYEFALEVAHRRGLTGKAAEQWAKKHVNEHWEGPGYYYHRGKGYFCRYSSTLDKERLSKYHKGKVRVGKGLWRHTHDLPGGGPVKPAHTKALKKVKVSLVAAKKLADQLEKLLPPSYKKNWTKLELINAAKLLKKLEKLGYNPKHLWELANKESYRKFKASLKRLVK